MFYIKYSKPIFDAIVSFLVLIGLSPILLLISVINLFQYRNVFFVQKRSGLYQKTFHLIKFQTMREVSINCTSDMERTTHFGKLLRNTSMDELPQLFLVLVGKMSLIGPRPLLVDYNDQFNLSQLKRFNLKPGISGLAQVSGRNSISWEKRFELDIYYVMNVSFKLDMCIFVKTFFQLLKFSEVNQSENQTMKPFKK